MRDVAAKCQRISGSEQVARFSVAIAQASLQQINELDSRVLESGEHLALVVHGDKERLEHAARTTLDRQQVIRVPALRAAANHFRTLSALDVLRAALL